MLSREISPLVEVPDRDLRAPATDFAYADGGGRVGFVASVSKPFCLNCNRIRLTSDGKIRYCLFAIEETDVKGLLRSGAPDEQIAAALKQNVSEKWIGHQINSAEVRSPAAAHVFDRRLIQFKVGAFATPECSNAALVAPKMHVQSRTETKSVLLADFGDPDASGVEGL